MGRNGEFEPRALEEGLLSIGFNIRSDISHLQTREALQEELARLHPESKPNRIRNFASQVNQFVNVAQVGDLVVCPMKTTSTIAIGRFTGPYAADVNGIQTRPVEWLATDLSRDVFRKDLLFSFGAIMTVCEIRRNNALSRVEAVLATGSDPGDGMRPAPLDTKSEAALVTVEELDDADYSLEQIARDQIERRVASVFTGHDFTRLVEAILTAQGYRTWASPPGPDAGTDIVAGRGVLGLESPRIVVQVKSGSVTADQPTLQALIGSVQDAQADHGLLVSWGGFTLPVIRRRNELYFRIRLWGRKELIDNLLAVYDQLPEDIRAELPLRRLWSLVVEDEDA